MRKIASASAALYLYLSLALIHCKGGDSEGRAPRGPFAKAKSASRLRAVWDAAEGGAKRFRHFEDSETGETCSFIKTGEDTEGNVYHCITPGSADAYYFDPDCQKMYLTVHDGDCGGAVEGDVVSAYRPSEDGCGGETDFVKVGAEIPSPANSYSVLSFSGQCEEIGIESPTTFFEAQPVSWDAYVQGRMRFEKLDQETEMGALVIHGADGSSYVAGAEVSGDACALTPSPEADEVYCILGAVGDASDTRFKSDSCEGARVLTVNHQDECPTFAPDFVMTWTSDECSQLESVRVRGEELERVYEAEADECLELNRSSTETYYALGEQAPDEEIVKLQISTVGSGRLSIQELSHRGTEFAHSNLWYDTELGVECRSMATTENGAIRCFPLEMGVFDFGRTPDGLGQLDNATNAYFADSSCTTAVHGLSVPSCASTEKTELPIAVELGEEAVCGQSTVARINELIPHAGKVYWDPGTGCEAVPEDQTRRWFLRGDEIPLSVFALIEVVID